MVSTISILGSTGSIGTQTLEVVAADPEQFRVVALGASSSVEKLAEQAQAFKSEVVAIADATLVDQLSGLVPPSTKVIGGVDALAEAATMADTCVNGVVGFAGLDVTLAALNAGLRLALANKESLIAAGPVVQEARRTPGAELIPVDSEHGAIHQCLGAVGDNSKVASIQLTASGGPFRGRSSDELAQVTVTDALAHPTWLMGPKITVDSSTLMNKGLEVIEAYELFGVPAREHGPCVSLDQIEVVVHPQSIVHSMVSFSDGSTIAQLSKPDMRLPIGYALAFPERLNYPFGAIDWADLGCLEFFEPDTEVFPCLGLAYQAAKVGGSAPAWVNAANEVAVEAFLEGQIRWIDIAEVISKVFLSHDGGTAETLDGVLDADRQARAQAAEAVVSKRGF